MREILFRGKAKNGEWVEGWFCGATCDDPDGDAYQSSQIIEKNSLFWVEVIPETVGQYTGLTDKNGTKIFEGDIVENAGIVGVVEYDDVTASFCITTYIRAQELLIPDDRIPFDFSYPVYILGNIHDNPELVSG